VADQSDMSRPALTSERSCAINWAASSSGSPETRFMLESKQPMLIGWVDELIQDRLRP
jgi:hypothetical protein